MKLLGILLFMILLVLCFAQFGSGRCGDNEIWAQCGQRCNPTCEDRHPYCVQDCRQSGCQCIAGYVHQNGRCVHNSQCTNGARCQSNYQCPSGSTCGASGYCRHVELSSYSKSSQYERRTYQYSTSSCQIDLDCPIKQICVKNQCRTAFGNTAQTISFPAVVCRVHNDCANGHICIDRICKPSNYMGVNEHVQSGTTLCRINSDCFAGKSCVDRICRYV